MKLKKCSPERFPCEIAWIYLICEVHSSTSPDPCIQTGSSGKTAGFWAHSPASPPDANLRPWAAPGEERGLCCAASPSFSHTTPQLRSSTSLVWDPGNWERGRKNSQNWAVQSWPFRTSAGINQISGFQPEAFLPFRRLFATILNCLKWYLFLYPDPHIGISASI